MRLLACSLFPLLTLLARVHGNCTTPPRQPYAALRNGELKDSYLVGTVLFYNCIPGYQFISRSNPSIKCLNSSEWSTTPTFCERKRCKAPVLENGGIESTGDLQFGEEIIYVCDPGYRPIGKTTARCTVSDGTKVQWDTTPPLCERIPCERPPTIVNGEHSGDASLDHYTVGDVVTYLCRGDLSLIGNSSIVCITAEDGINGMWDRPAPECKAVQCSRPQIENGRLTSAYQPTYKYEHVLQFVCHSGYSLVGREFVECGADNKWQPELPACVKIAQCNRPQIQNGKLTSGFQPLYQYEHVLQFVCDAGYTMVGSDFVKCGANNTWYPELPTCVKGKPTVRPDATEETVTKEAGSTQSPGGTDPKDDSGNNTVGIIVGAVVGVLALAAVIFVLIKWRPGLKKG